MTRVSQEECARLRENVPYVKVHRYISVYFNIRDIVPKSGTFLLGHPVYGDKNVFFTLMRLNVD